MTIEEQREAIREGLVRFCECEHMGDSEECPNCEFGLAFVDRILAFLTEMGAVLKVSADDTKDKGVHFTAPLMEKK